MSVPRARLIDLMKVQCRVFNTTFNPEGLRLGNKVLRQRLRGPALAAWYPRRVLTVKDVQKAFPDYWTWDEQEEDRIELLQITKARGKGAPAKKKTKEVKGKKKK